MATARVPSKKRVISRLMCCLSNKAASMNFLTKILFALFAMASLAIPAHAKYNGEDRGRPLLPSQVNAKWQQECASCHMAFPPGLLPAASWKKMMSGLDQHFGADASIKSRSNCMACHAGADKGNFDEHKVMIPK